LRKHKASGEWHVHFPLSNATEITQLVEWLAEKRDGENPRLREGNSVEPGEHGILIISPSQDAAFRCGEFIRNANPLGRKLFYSVQAFDRHGRKIFDTAWKRDLKDTPKRLLAIVRASHGRITLPREVRIKLNIADGSRLALFVDDRKRILLVPSQRGIAA
jgi:AbrB family looped-hinge helix DNA binding protein